MNRSIKVVDFTHGKKDSDNVDTNIPFKKNFAEAKTIQSANVIIASYTNKNITDLAKLENKTNILESDLNNLNNKTNLLEADVNNLNNEINLKADKTEIPTKTSDLTNDSNYIKASYNDWAWTAGSLTASKQENALFFVSGMNVYKYVIGDITSLETPLFTVPAGRMIYGTGMNVDPTSNQVIVTTIVGYGADSAKNNLYFYDGTTGSLKKNLFYEGIWFPSVILFSEN